MSLPWTQPLINLNIIVLEHCDDKEPFYVDGLSQLQIISFNIDKNEVYTGQLFQFDDKIDTKIRSKSIVFLRVRFYFWLIFLPFNFFGDPRRECKTL